MTPMARRRGEGKKGRGRASALRRREERESATASCITLSSLNSSAPSSNLRARSHHNRRSTLLALRRRRFRASPALFYSLQSPSSYLIVRLTLLSNQSHPAAAAYQLPRLEHTVRPFRAGESLASGTAVGEEWLRGSRGCSRASYPSRELSNGRAKPSRARSGKETDALSKLALDPRLGEELRERSGSCRSIMKSEPG